MTDETKKILIKALEQLVVYAKNDKTLSWNWDRKTEGQYRLEIIVDTSNPHERVVNATLAEMDKMWINYVDNTLQIEFEELMKKHNKCVKGRKGVPREVSDYLASYYNDLIEINNSKCSL